jgi:apolipoprotein D and lipocalin family protein
MLLWISIVVFLSVFSQSFAAECPKIVTQKDFNATKYLGLWYEVERNNIIFEIASKCENATYTANPNGTVGVYNQAVVAFTGYYTIRGIARPKDPAVPGALEVIFVDPPRTGDYNVITTDYNEYALVYACQTIPILGYKLEFIWLLSRTKTLSPSRINELKKILQDMGADVGSVKPTVQDCS